MRRHKQVKQSKQPRKRDEKMHNWERKTTDEQRRDETRGIERKCTAKTQSGNRKAGAKRVLVVQVQ